MRIFYSKFPDLKVVDRGLSYECVTDLQHESDATFPLTRFAARLESQC